MLVTPIQKIKNKNFFLWLHKGASTKQGCLSTALLLTNA